MVYNYGSSSPDVVKTLKVIRFRDPFYVIENLSSRRKIIIDLATRNNINLIALEANMKLHGGAMGIAITWPA